MASEKRFSKTDVKSIFDMLEDNGVDIPKETLHKNINTRLHTRLEDGMIHEVETLLENGVTPQRLDDFGLE